MKKKLHILIACLACLPLVSRAQFDCSNGRFIDEVFQNVTVTTDVTYGANHNMQGQLQSLELDIYEPTGDTASLRPLIVMQHGGSFIGGAKDAADIVELAEPLARRGYVVVSAEYRLGMAGLPFPGPDSSDASNSVWRAVSDFKAAVRFFYKDAAINGNTYRIDTNNIFIGGVSAGAVSAVHYAFLDRTAEIPSYIDTTSLGMGGGLEGSSGNQGYSSKPRAVINLCGMLADTAWMEPGDEPIVSLHGTIDDVVPYGSDMITVAGFYQIFVVDGSASIHDRADQIGLDNCLHTWPGAGHTPQIGSATYTDTTLNVVTNFLSKFLCGANPTCGYVVSNDKSIPMAEIAVFPNPSHGQFNVRVPADWTQAWDCQLFDMTGRKMAEWNGLQGSEFEIPANGFPAGIYHVKVGNGLQVGESKVVLMD